MAGARHRRPHLPARIALLPLERMDEAIAVAAAPGVRGSSSGGSGAGSPRCGAATRPNRPHVRDFRPGGP